MKGWNSSQVLKTLLVMVVVGIECIEGIEEDSSRGGKILPIFQIVRFPNDPCDTSTGKNGTCYTAEECSSRSGVSSESCAQGFGVCCIFSLGCGTTTSENCTYFESTNNGGGTNAGACSLKICKCSNDICQIRLDFNNFVISGPSTATASVGKILNGELATGAGVAVSESGRCLTDIFTISDQETVPLICGVNTGAHVYFDASDACNSLDFQFGNSATGISSIATRSYSIKATQISCNSDLLAPNGCTQYYFGPGATNSVRTFNFDGGRHIEQQDQQICVRRESGMCRICWYAAALTDFATAGMSGIALNQIKASLCCAYGADGAGATGPYDCIMIPGAQKADDGTALPVSQCGGSGGLVTAAAAAMNGKTICSMAYPFRVNFLSDVYESTAAAIDEGGLTGTVKQVGFKLNYFQTAC